LVQQPSYAQPASRSAGLGDPILWRYGLALSLSALALLLALLLWPLMESSIFFLLVGAVAISAVYGGLGPGLVATFLSALASAYFFVPPRYSLLVDPEGALLLGTFVLVGLMVSWLTDRRKQAEARRLEHKASHDYLTDLPNRLAFYENLRRALARARRQGSRVAVLFVDLDDFKPINDSFGHQIGDRALVEVAERLKRCLRRADTAARLGGDEFAVLMEDISEAVQALAVAERILAEVRAPLDVVGGHRVFVSASIGIALGGAGQAEELLRAADVAMYRAKSAGKARSVVVDLDAPDDATQRSP
jgi:diguanylate cyclase (GGDEF)-like protein